MEQAVELDRQMHEVVRTLQRLFASRIDPLTVERVVQDEAARLVPGARVQTYLPLLVWKRSRERLDALGGTHTGALNPVPQPSRDGDVRGSHQEQNNHQKRGSTTTRAA